MLALANGVSRIFGDSEQSNAPQEGLRQDLLTPLLAENFEN